jgi:hypothetical protein
MPCHQQQHAGGDQLVLGERLAVVLGLDQRREQVLARACPAGGDQLAEVRGELFPGRLRAFRPDPRELGILAELRLERVSEPG